MARNAAELSKNLTAIVNLPIAFLEDNFDLRYLPEFRVAGPRNPVGCWFQSYGQGGGVSPKKGCRRGLGGSPQGIPGGELAGDACTSGGKPRRTVEDDQRRPVHRLSTSVL